MNSSNGRHRVVMVGSDFGGLATAKNLRRAPVDVTWIDRTNHQRKTELGLGRSWR